MKRAPLISIVDDDQLVREAVADLVSSLGFRASTFASAECFLDSGEADQTSCLISDIQMPGLNGLELQKQLLVSGRNIPVIFVTAYPREIIHKQALEAGAVSFLTKPFEEACLIKSIEIALERKKSPDT